MDVQKSYEPGFFFEHSKLYKKWNYYMFIRVLITMKNALQKLKNRRRLKLLPKKI